MDKYKISLVIIRILQYFFYSICTLLIFTTLWIDIKHLINKGLSIDFDFVMSNSILLILGIACFYWGYKLQKFRNSLIYDTDDIAKIKNKNFDKKIQALSDKKDVKGLLNLLKKKLKKGYSFRDESHNNILSALEKIGPPALNPLMNTIQFEDNSTMRWMIAEVLEKIGDKKAVPILIETLKDSNASVRSTAALSLGKLNALEAFNDLLIMLADESQTVRYKAADALGNLRNNKAVKPLIKLAKVELIAKGSTYSIINALAKIGGPDAEDFLIELYKSDKDSRLNIRKSLPMIGGQKTIDFFSEILSKESSSPHIYASCLFDVGEKAIPFLISILNRRSTEARDHTSNYDVVGTLINHSKSTYSKAINNSERMMKEIINKVDFSQIEKKNLLKELEKPYNAEKLMDEALRAMKR